MADKSSKRGKSKIDGSASKSPRQRVGTGIGSGVSRSVPTRRRSRPEDELERLRRNYPDLDDQAIKAILQERKNLQNKYEEKPAPVPTDRLINILSKAKSVRWQEVNPGQILLQSEDEDAKELDESAAKRIGQVLAAARKESRAYANASG